MHPFSTLSADPAFKPPAFENKKLGSRRRHHGPPTGLSRRQALSNGMEFNRQTVAKLQPGHEEKADQLGCTCLTPDLQNRNVAFRGFPITHFLAHAPSQPLINFLISKQPPQGAKRKAQSTIRNPEKSSTWLREHPRPGGSS